MAPSVRERLETSYLGYMSTAQLSHSMGHSGQKLTLGHSAQCTSLKASSFEAKESIPDPVSFSLQLSPSPPQPCPLQVEFQGLPHRPITGRIQSSGKVPMAPIWFA